MSEQTMRDVSQRNPLDPENVFERVFQRGPDVAADGGKRSAEARASEDTEPSDGEHGDERRTRNDEKRDRRPPGESVDVNRVWERGGEAAPCESDEDTEE